MQNNIQRSFVIPVLDFSPHGPYNIRTLLQDLEDIRGEVICIFNSPEVYQELKSHPRIDKFCYNNLNAGVSRSWNIGINMAEGRAVFIMNADLHVGPKAIDMLESYLLDLPNAVIVGPQGTHLDFKNLKTVHYFKKGRFNEPVQTHDVSGFLFCLDREKYNSSGLRFDVRYSPCFMEEWDMGMQVLNANLACFAVPVTDFDHHWGISDAEGDTKIAYFGRDYFRNELLLINREKFRRKWFGKASNLPNGI